MRTATVAGSQDLTAKARIRQAALRRFGQEGFDATSVRDVAADAGVSPGLVIHHFGSKDGLRKAVDEAVTDRFEQSLDGVPGDLPFDELTMAWGTAFADIIGPDPVLRAYLRRSVLEDTAAGSHVLDHLMTAIADGVEQMRKAGGLRPGVDRRWVPFQVLFVTLGSLLFEPLLQRQLDGHAFDPEVVRRRSAANHELVAHGLLRA